VRVWKHAEGIMRIYEDDHDAGGSSASDAGYRANLQSVVFEYIETMQKLETKLNGAASGLMRARVEAHRIVPIQVFTMTPLERALHLLHDDENDSERMKTALTRKLGLTYRVVE
jgi:hypothetical protein